MHTYLRSIILYTFIHSSVNEYLGCFHYLGKLIHAAVNTEVKISLACAYFMFLVAKLVKELMQHMPVLLLTLWRPLVVFSKMLFLIYTNSPSLSVLHTTAFCMSIQAAITFKKRINHVQCIWSLILGKLQLMLFFLVLFITTL